MKLSTNKTRLALVAGIAALSVMGLLAADRSARAAKPEGQKTMLAHMVYFTLNESTEANRRKLVAACDKYLSDHPGTVFYGAGTVSDLDREVNDRDYDVGLQVVFKDRASHDTYQDAAKHQQFIKENKDTWKKVRVFDTDLTPSARAR